jgi:hypothetical protein
VAALHEQYERAFHGSGITAIGKKKAKAQTQHTARRRQCNAPRQTSPASGRRGEWDEAARGKLVDLSSSERDILPLIRDIPLSRLQRATGLSLRYVSLIRRGERTPHPRHWQSLLRATALAEEEEE